MPDMWLILKCLDHIDQDLFQRSSGVNMVCDLNQSNAAVLTNNKVYLSIHLSYVLCACVHNGHDVKMRRPRFMQST